MEGWVVVVQVELDHSRAALPLYLQLANALNDVITLEQLKPGDVLPSESVLAMDNHLSRATVIKAFDMLVERGLVTRRQGKGTFVNARPMQRQLPELTSFSEHVHGLGMTPSSSLLRFETFRPGAMDRPVSPFRDSETLVLVERLRRVDGASVGVHRVLVPLDVADAIGLTEKSAAEPKFSLYASLHAGGIFLSAAEETMQAVNAEGRDAELLEVEEGTALIEVVRESRDATGKLIEFVRARYLGSKYVYRISFATSPHGEHDDKTALASFRSGSRLATPVERL